MAKLTGSNGYGSTWFSISPIPAAVAGEDSTEYSVQIGPTGTDSITSARQFSVAGWQMQHDDVWVFARAFAETPTLIGLKVPIDLWRIGRHEKAILFESATWVSAVLWGNERQQKIRILLFVEEDPSLNLFRHFVIIADVKQTAIFGVELEQEIIAANPNWAAERNLKMSAVDATTQ